LIINLAIYKKEGEMAQIVQDNTIYDAVELLMDNGFDGLAAAVTGLLNTAMVAEGSEYLGVDLYLKLTHPGCQIMAVMGQSFQ
jgi:hypothetical protein